MNKVNRFKHVFSGIGVACVVLLCMVTLGGCFLGNLRGPAGLPGEDGKTFTISWETYFEYLWEQNLVDKNKYLNSEGNPDYNVFLLNYPREQFVMPNDTQYASNIAIQSAVDIVNVAHSKGGAGVIYKLYEDVNGYTGDGYIITNYHVISRGVSGVLYTATTVQVYLYKMTAALTAHVVGGAPEYDVAILRLNGADPTIGNTIYGSTTRDVIRKAPVRPAEIPERWEPAIGSSIIAVGNPLNWEMSVTSGIISMQTEYIEMENWWNPGTHQEYRVMRTDTAINSGNSGGGLFNMRGELVGIVQARMTGSSIVGMAYAIPLDVTLRVANQMIARRDANEQGLLQLQKANFNSFMNSFEVEGIYPRAVYCPVRSEVIFSETVRVVSRGSSGLYRYDEIIGIKIKSTGKTYEITRAHQVDEIFIEARTASNVEFIIR